MARRRRNRIEEEAAQLRKQRREMLRQRKVDTERRKLMAALAPVLVLVFGFVLFGWFRLEWWQPRQPVARVAGTAITADVYGKRVQFARRQTLNNLSSLMGFLQSTDPSFIESYVQGQRTNVAQQTLDQMIDEGLVREEAEARGITVTDEEIDERICGELSQATGATLDGDEDEAEDGEAEDAADTDEDAADSEEASEEGEASDEDAEADSSDEADEEGAAEDEEEGDEEDTAAPSDELVCALEGAELDRAFETVLVPQLEQAGMGRRDYEELVRAQLFRDKLSDSLGEELDTTAEQAEIEYLLFTDESVADDALTALAGGDSWAAVSARFERPEEPEVEEDAAADENEDEAADDADSEDETAEDADSEAGDDADTESEEGEGDADDADADADTEEDEATDADAEDDAADEATEEDVEAAEGDDATTDESEETGDEAAEEDEATDEDAADTAGENEDEVAADEGSEDDAAEETDAEGDDADTESEEGETAEGDEADAEADAAAEGEDEAAADEVAAPEPEPYAFDIAEPQWFTTEQLQTRLGLTQTEVEEIFALDDGANTEPLQGSQGFYILHVLDKDADRTIDEGELQRLKDSVIDEWLTETRIAKSSEISRFPTDGLIPAEPDWFVQGFNQLMSSLGGQAPLDLGGVDTSSDTGDAGDAGGGDVGGADDSP